MIKISKQKVIITAILLTLLLISSTYGLMPSAKAESVSPQDKTNLILNNVLNIDTNAYSTKLNSQADKYGPLEKSLTDITLSANNTSVRVSASFVNDSLHLLMLSEYSGAFAKTKPASASVDMAKDFLVKYRAYTGDSFYSTLALTLNDPTVVNNATKTTGNVMLKVSNYDQKIVNYIWTYVDENGVVAAIKNICLSYDQGRLSSFLNNWPLYKIADTKATISHEQAVKIALAAAENYTYQVNINNTTSTISVAGFKYNPDSLSMAALSYDNSQNQSLARDSAFTLYPSWYIPLGFDKAYPADVTGVAVTIWADTGEVSGMSPMTCGGAYEASTQYQSSESSFLLGPAITFVLVLCLMALFVNRKRLLRLMGTNKLGNLKFWSLLFCLSILSGFTVSTVNATPTTSSRIYASNWDQMSEETTAMQYNVKPYLTTYFNGNAEFDLFDNTQTGTVLSSIQAYANYDGATYNSAIVFYLGHMALPNNMPNPGLRDNAAQLIMPSDISPYTQAGRHRFVFMWACNQAVPGASSGMVQAWLPGITSSDGVVAPDSSGKCFISFDGTSPPIADWTPNPTFNDMSSYPMEWFIVWFYYDTIVEHHTIAYALNHASQEIVGHPFTDSKLYTGYHTYWPNPGSQHGYHVGRMVVCGDANIYLWQYIRTLSISSSSGGYTSPTGAQQYWQDTIATVTAYPDTGSGYAFDHWIYDGWLNIYQNPVQVCMGDDHTLTPVFVQNTYTTTINWYQTWGGNPDYITYMDSTDIQLPYGSNYFDFTGWNGYFMWAYNYADSSMHYSSADWYWTGTGTSIDVLWTW